MIGGVFSFPVIAYFPAILLEQLSYNPAIFPAIIALLYLYPLILFLKRCPNSGCFIFNTIFAPIVIKSASSVSVIDIFLIFL